MAENREQDAQNRSARLKAALRANLSKRKQRDRDGSDGRPDRPPDDQQDR